MNAWVTNDPQMAARFKAIDRAWDKARAKASGWALAEKLSAYRRADEAREKAYDRIRSEITCDKRAYREWCRKPEACVGKGYCPLDPNCGD